MSARRAAVCPAVLLAVLATSCGGGLIPRPEDYRCLQGEYVAVYYAPDLEGSQIERILQTADNAWLTVLDLCDVPAALRPAILIDETGPTELRTSWSSWYQHGTAVHLNELILSYGEQYTRSVLRHELAHLAAGAEHGYCEYIFLSEGMAVYAGAMGKPEYAPDEQERLGITSTLGQTYGDVTAAWRDGVIDDAGLYRLYDLSGAFARYWIERFGLESWFRLYDGFTATDPEASIEAACGLSTEEVCTGFVQYSP